MITPSRSTLGFITLAVGALVALSGCSGVTAGVEKAAAPTQSKAAACSSLEKSMTSSVDGLRSAFSSVATDPKGAISALETVADNFDGALAKISNKQVHEAGAKAKSSLDTMVAQIKTISADPANVDQTAFLATTKAVQQDFTAVGTVCK